MDRDEEDEYNQLRDINLLSESESDDIMHDKQNAQDILTQGQLRYAESFIQPESLSNVEYDQLPAHPGYAAE